MHKSSSDLISSKDALKIMRQRHSVRQYFNRPIEQQKREILNKTIEDINKISGLNLQIIYDEPKCLNNHKPGYGTMKGCNNYICMIGKKAPNRSEVMGYWGEILVLKAQELGLNTCWIGLITGKAKVKVKKGEKLKHLIAIGYGQNQGKQHKNKTITETLAFHSFSQDQIDIMSFMPSSTCLAHKKEKSIYKKGSKTILNNISTNNNLDSDLKANKKNLKKVVAVLKQKKPINENTIKVLESELNSCPVWFKNGYEACMLSPTSINQQQFLVVFDKEKEIACIADKGGILSKVDLGILKCQFELASGHKVF
ncbi:MAG: hypothetical protein MJ189_04620 [Coriobacteriales bacterium]|nr:hypothetical protein [Coriobacteriales bacterium]